MLFLLGCVELLPARDENGGVAIAGSYWSDSKTERCWHR
jgi:hypothetical protein